MKKYYYQIIKVGRERSRGGNRYVYADVLTVKYGGITKLGQVKWQSAGQRGEDVVYEFLYQMGLVGKREYKNNRGYYYRNKSKVEILEIGE